MILVSDIGATNTRLAIFSKTKMRVQKTYPSHLYPDFSSILKQFLQESPAKIDVFCLAVAGPVKNGTCRVTNLDWVLDAAKIKKDFKISKVALLNDAEAHAWGISCLGRKDFLTLNDKPVIKGNAAFICAGTGLGEAGLFWNQKKHIPFASEGGHVDFAARSKREHRLFIYLKKRYEHISYERILSGSGLVILYQFLVEEEGFAKNPALEKRFAKEDAAHLITASGLAATCQTSREALMWFISMYGAEAGNLALKMLASGGLYIGGGIAAKIAPLMKKGSFMEAFLGKGRFKGFLENVPVKVILNENSALWGAFRFSRENLLVK